MKRVQKHIPVRLSGLGDGIHEHRLQVLPTEIGLPASFDTVLDVGISADKSHGQVALNVHVRTVATESCDRCLQEVTVPVDAHFSLVYVYNEDDARAYDDDDVRIVDSNEAVVDISDDVRDCAMLCIPMRVTCAEEDGEASCTLHVDDEQIVGSGAAIDPRWEKLRELQTVHPGADETTEHE